MTTMGLKCGQKNCTNIAAFTHTWPGESGNLGVCQDHIDQLSAVAKTMGVNISLVPIEKTTFQSGYAEAQKIEDRMLAFTNRADVPDMHKLNYLRTIETASRLALLGMYDELLKEPAANDPEFDQPTTE